MTPLPPSLPKNVRDPLDNISNRLRRVEQPGRPMPFYVNETATSLATLGLAAVDYENCAVWLRALKTLAVSNGTSWIRQDTQGALA